MQVVFPAVIAGVALAWGSVALGQADLQMDAVQQRLRNAVLAAKDEPLSKNADAGQVITALRSTGDQELLPLFMKIRQSKSAENQVYAMVAAAILAKQAGMDPEAADFNYVDIKALLAAKDLALLRLREQLAQFAPELIQFVS